MPSVCVEDINAYVQRCDRQKYQKICLSLHKPEYLEVTWTKTRFGKRVDTVLFTREVWRLVLSQEFLNGEPQLSDRSGLNVLWGSHGSNLNNGFHNLNIVIFGLEVS